MKYVINQENAKNPLVKTGDFITFNAQVKNSKDSIINWNYFLLSIKKRRENNKKKTNQKNNLEI